MKCKHQNTDEEILMFATYAIVNAMAKFLDVPRGDVRRCKDCGAIWIFGKWFVRKPK